MVLEKSLLRKISLDSLARGLNKFKPRRFFYHQQTKFVKVMFLHLSFCPRGGGACVAGGGHAWKGVCVVGGHAWQGGCAWWGVCMAGGHVWRGACVAGRACVAGGHAWQREVCVVGVCVAGGVHGRRGHA